MKVTLTLFIQPQSDDNADVLSFVRRRLERYGPEKLELVIVDVERWPEKTAAENIICVPCLVVRTATSKVAFVLDLVEQASEIEELIESGLGS